MDMPKRYSVSLIVETKKWWHDDHRYDQVGNADTVEECRRLAADARSRCSVYGSKGFIFDRETRKHIEL